MKSPMTIQTITAQMRVITIWAADRDNYAAGRTTVAAWLRAPASADTPVIDA
jgi:hypothetical protein